MKTVITGWGSYVPDVLVTNEMFGSKIFFDEKNQQIKHDSQVIVRKFQSITGIEERRYAQNEQNASDIGAIAGEKAIQRAGIDRETIDQIIVAHNFGDVKHGTIQTDILPGLSARIKHHLGIKNPECVAYDILFGCPGWLQGVIQAHQYIQGGFAKRCLVIGTETLSRVLDLSDRDSMIFSDGAGAVILEGKESTGGVIATAALSYTTEEVDYLNMGPANIPDADEKVRYIKMKGRKIYEFALTNVPAAMKACLEKTDISIHQIKKVLIHQANEKMDEGIIKRFYELFNIHELPEGIMPMSIHKLGNSSVGTVPTLFDLVANGQMPDHQFSPGDHIIMASVGAGMHINAVLYQFPE